MTTLAEAQENLAAWRAADLAGASEFGSVSISGRSVTYRNAAEIKERIQYWENMVARLQRRAAGAPRHGRSVASFRC